MFLFVLGKFLDGGGQTGLLAGGGVVFDNPALLRLINCLVSGWKQLGCVSLGAASDQLAHFLHRIIHQTLAAYVKHALALR